MTHHAAQAAIDHKKNDTNWAPKPSSEPKEAAKEAEWLRMAVIARISDSMT